jgi:electron transfer flavoprotein alpha subunit
MTILVIAEHDATGLRSATANAVTAARQLGTDVHVLIAGARASAAAEAAARFLGVTRVLIAESPALADGRAEPVTALVLTIASRYAHIVLPATAAGKNLAPRIAARLDVAQISEVIAIESPDTFQRPIYAGNAIATVRSTDAIKVLTVRTTAFDAIPDADEPAPVEALLPIEDTSRSVVVRRELATSERPELTAARAVVAGGRGMGSADNFRLLEPLADALGAALGASRAAVDAGYAPNDWQVGQTGKIVAPQVYVAVGISGAIQHLAGMKDSRMIVAINKDPEAPVFSVADFGLVADLFDAVPKLSNALSAT